MTPRRRWLQTNRPQTQPNSLLHSDFRGNRPDTRSKKSADVLNVRRGCCDLLMWERLSLPIGCIRRERPSTPSAPYSLTRPVVPPDGSFIFGTDFLKEAAPRRGLPTADFPFVCVTRDIFWCLFERNDRGALRNAAMLPCSLTVKGADNSVLVRVFSIAARSVAARTGQLGSFPQNIHVTSN